MSKYKESLVARLRLASARTLNGLDLFFNKNLDENERLLALRHAGSFVDKSDILKGRVVLDDISEPVTIRSAALRGLIHQLAHDGEMMDELINMLNDAREPEVMKKVAL